jgi:hypothetical protein
MKFTLFILKYLSFSVLLIGSRWRRRPSSPVRDDEACFQSERKLATLRIHALEAGRDFEVLGKRRAGGGVRTAFQVACRANA